MRTITAGILVAATLVASAVNADVTLKHFKAARAAGGDGWEIMKLYFEGAGGAYMFANAKLSLDHKPRLFCPPDNFSFTGQNYIDILSKQLAAASPPFKDDFVIDGLLLYGLIDTFPCKP